MRLACLRFVTVCIEADGKSSAKTLWSPELLTVPFKPWLKTYFVAQKSSRHSSDTGAHALKTIFGRWYGGKRDKVHSRGHVLATARMLRSKE